MSLDSHHDRTLSVPATDVATSATPIAEVCNHTLHHKDPAGKLAGTWIETSGAYGIRVSCRVCGKFFGYHPKEADRTDEELYKAYLEQQRRLACPGCGEEPFLG